MTMQMPKERVTANLPGSDWDATTTFCGLLGFDVVSRSPEWMILRRGPLEIKFFPMKYA